MRLKLTIRKSESIVCKNVKKKKKKKSEDGQILMPNDVGL